MQVVEKTAFEDEADRKQEFAAQRREAEAEKVRDAYNQLKFTAVRHETRYLLICYLWTRSRSLGADAFFCDRDN